MKYASGLLFALFFLGTCYSSELASHKSKAIDFQNLSMIAELNSKGDELQFTVFNNSDKDLLVADDFCFIFNLKNFILAESDLSMRRDNYSSEISHTGRQMALLKAHGKYSCALDYSSNSEKKAKIRENVLIFWNTDLFVGDMNENYGSKHFVGVVPATSPLESNSPLPEPEINESILHRYKNRECCFGIKK